MIQGIKLDIIYRNEYIIFILWESTHNDHNSATDKYFSQLKNASVVHI